MSDKLNSAVNALKKSPRRPSGRDIEAEQARRQQADALRVHAAGVDSCEGRLESLKVLYDAGILDREEYTQRVARVKSRHTLRQ